VDSDALPVARSLLAEVENFLRRVAFPRRQHIACGLALADTWEHRGAANRASIWIH
jgi:hypothetical protein